MWRGQRATLYLCSKWLKYVRCGMTWVITGAVTHRSLVKTIKTDFHINTTSSPQVSDKCCPC